MDPDVAEVGTGFNALLFLARFGRINEARALLEYGADVNFRVRRPTLVSGYLTPRW